MNISERFYAIVKIFSDLLGSFYGFLYAATLIIFYMIDGPYSKLAEKLMNTTFFLALFLIQNSQNRGDKVQHLKLDELIRASEQTNDTIINSEILEEKEIDKLQQEIVDCKNSK